MSWSTAFRLRQFARGSLWLLPLAGGLLGVLLGSGPVTWIRDSGGRWHATRTLGRSGNAGGTALRVEVVPALSRATTWIEVITTGRSAEARARLPLRWE